MSMGLTLYALFFPSPNFFHEASSLIGTQAYALFPQSFKDIIELLLPELKARGLFWDGYAVENGTYRENFYGVKGQKVPLDEHVASTYQWKAGVPASEHGIPAEPPHSS